MNSMNEIQTDPLLWAAVAFIRRSFVKVRELSESTHEYSLGSQSSASGVQQLDSKCWNSRVRIQVVVQAVQILHFNHYKAPKTSRHNAATSSNRRKPASDDIQCIRLARSVCL